MSHVDPITKNVSRYFYHNISNSWKGQSFKKGATERLTVLKFG